MDKKSLTNEIAKLPSSYTKGLDMHGLIDPALNSLPELLKDGAQKWDGIYIDYEPPFLMRLYRSFEVKSLEDGTPRKLFLSLHYFFSNNGDGESDNSGFLNPYIERPHLIGKENANNYHPHPWAAAFFILKGTYKQELGLAVKFGYSADKNSTLRPEPYATKIQTADNLEQCSYAFNNPYQWHRVLPNAYTDVATLMLTYKPCDWSQVGPKPTNKQRPLTNTEKEFMIKYFSNLLDAKSQKLSKRNGPQKKFSLT